MHEKIKEAIKEAMKAKDSVKIATLRSILALITNHQIEKKLDKEALLPDEDVIMLIKRLAKQRKDSIEQFKSGGRDDLVEAESAELSILEEYLPEAMSEEEIKKIINEVVSGIDDKSKIGVVIGQVMKKIGSQADGLVVKKLIEEKLAN